MKTVNDLLNGLSYELINGNIDVEIKQVAYDSRKVTRDTLFVCVKGYVSDGHTFLRAAAEMGATAIVIQDDQTVFTHSQLHAVKNSVAVFFL